jgi:uncharacterized membrane protein
MLTSGKPHYTKIEIILEVISILALLTFLIFTYFTWSSVPERIPDHFNWSGMPNSWGSKGTVPIMVYLTVFIFILFSIISRFPRAINFPIPIKEENSKSHLQLRFSLILWTKTELVLITSYLGIQGIRVALGYAEGLGTYVVPIILAVLFGTGAIFIYRAYKLKSTNNCT